MADKEDIGIVGHEHDLRSRMSGFGPPSTVRRGGGQGPRGNHNRIPHNGGAKKAEAPPSTVRDEREEAMERRITDAVLKGLKAFMTPFEDHLFNVMPDNGVGIRCCFLNTPDEPVKWGKKGKSAPWSVMATEGAQLGLRVGVAPFIFLSQAAQLMEKLNSEGNAGHIPPDLKHANWGTNENIYHTHQVWMRVQVTLHKRLSGKDEVGTCHGASFLSLRVIPNSWMGSTHNQGFELGMDWETFINEAPFHKVEAMFKAKAKITLPSHERVKLYSYECENRGEPIANPTEDQEIDMRYPSPQSTVPLLNTQINKIIRYLKQIEEGVEPTNDNDEEEIPSSVQKAEEELIQQISESVQKTQLMEDSLMQQIISRLKQDKKDRENPISHEFSGNSEIAPKAYEASWSAESGVKVSNTQMYNADNELSQDSIRKLQQMGMWYKGDLNNRNIDSEYKHWLVIAENMPHKKEAHVSYSSTTQPTLGVNGFKIPHISEDSMKKLRIMDDWYKGSLNDSEISEKFNTWWYLQQRCLEMAQHNVALTHKKETSTGTGVVRDPNPLAPELVRNVNGSGQSTTPHYFSHSPTPNGPVIYITK